MECRAIADGFRACRARGHGVGGIIRRPPRRHEERTTAACTHRTIGCTRLRARVYFGIDSPPTPTSCRLRTTGHVALLRRSRRAGAGAPSHPGGPTRPAWRHRRNVGAVRANRAEMAENRPYTVHCRPALQPHTQLQLLSARVPVQTLTEQGLNREGRTTQAP